MGIWKLVLLLLLLLLVVVSTDSISTSQATLKISRVPKPARAPKQRHSLSFVSHPAVGKSSNAQPPAVESLNPTIGEAIGLTMASMASTLFWLKHNRKGESASDEQRRRDLELAKDPKTKFGMNPLPYNISSGSLLSGRFTIDLGEPKMVGALLVSNSESSSGSNLNGAKDFVIQTSNDLLTWSVAHRSWLCPGRVKGRSEILQFLLCRESEGRATQLVYFSARAARYIRFRTLSCYPGGDGLISCKVYAQKGTRWFLAVSRPVDALQNYMDSLLLCQDFSGSLDLPDEVGGNIETAPVRIKARSPMANLTSWNLCIKQYQADGPEGVFPKSTWYQVVKMLKSSARKAGTEISVQCARAVTRIRHTPRIVFNTSVTVLSTPGQAAKQFTHAGEHCLEWLDAFAGKIAKWGGSVVLSLNSASGVLGIGVMLIAYHFVSSLTRKVVPILYINDDGQRKDDAHSKDALRSIESDGEMEQKNWERERQLRNREREMEREKRMKARKAEMDLSKKRAEEERRAKEKQMAVLQLERQRVQLEKQAETARKAMEGSVLAERKASEVKRIAGDKAKQTSSKGTAEKVEAFKTEDVSVTEGPSAKIVQVLKQKIEEVSVNRKLRRERERSERLNTRQKELTEILKESAERDKQRAKSLADKVVMRKVEGRGSLEREGRGVFDRIQNFFTSLSRSFEVEPEKRADSGSKVAQGADGKASKAVEKAGQGLEEEARKRAEGKKQRELDAIKRRAALDARLSKEISMPVEKDRKKDEGAKGKILPQLNAGKDITKRLQGQTKGKVEDKKGKEAEVGTRRMRVEEQKAEKEKQRLKFEEEATKREQARLERERKHADELRRAVDEVHAREAERAREQRANKGASSARQLSTRWESSIQRPNDRAQAKLERERKHAEEQRQKVAGVERKAKEQEAADAERTRLERLKFEQDAAKRAAEAKERDRMRAEKKKVEEASLEKKAAGAEKARLERLKFEQDATKRAAEAKGRDRMCAEKDKKVEEAAREKKAADAEKARLERLKFEQDAAKRAAEAKERDRMRAEKKKKVEEAAREKKAADAEKERLERLKFEQDAAKRAAEAKERDRMRAEKKKKVEEAAREKKAADAEKARLERLKFEQDAAKRAAEAKERDRMRAEKEKKVEEAAREKEAAGAEKARLERLKFEQDAARRAEARLERDRRLAKKATASDQVRAKNVVESKKNAADAVSKSDERAQAKLERERRHAEEQARKVAAVESKAKGQEAMDAERTRLERMKFEEDAAKRAAAMMERDRMRAEKLRKIQAVATVGGSDWR